MDKNKVLIKLEQDLAGFLIEEACKNDPSLRGSSEMYKYKGIGLTTNERTKDKTKVIAVSMGPLEARFKVENCDKVSGNLNPEDERLIQMWLNKTENHNQIRSIFAVYKEKKEIGIIPFDLEEFYDKR